MNGGDKPIRIMLQRPFAQTLTLPPATVAEIDPTGPHLRQDTSSFMLPAEIEQGVSQTDQGSNLRATK